LPSSNVNRITTPEIGIRAASWPVSLTLAALATWRLTHLLTEEDGPADVVLRLRRLAGPGLLGQVMDCFYCTSVWVALPFAVGLTSERVATVPRARSGRSRPAPWARRSVAWLALSGAACLLEQATRPRGAPQLDDLGEDLAGHPTRARGPQEVQAVP